MLGMILLELCFGQPIEGIPWRVRPEAETSDQATAYDWMAAMKWLEEVNSEAGLDYADAVEWCLRGCTKLDPGAPWRRERCATSLLRWSDVIRASEDIAVS
ncbi:hypothetical protein B0T25DRAFT_560646 [Lasiosphaeria hispida]|uniref:DUF7580 domain-containing protein n=1 Tax=Lasiosphaeria hispida TaxID=260671 RepID=A0AAJ0H559_9PEZI|nr:hypothetical protein B0T25DRAFT_560646 [Lasiosphaeria hispida]